MADPVQQMMEMGFDESRSRKALSVCNNNGVRNLDTTDRIVFNWDAVRNREARLINLSRQGRSICILVLFAYDVQRLLLR